MLAIEPLYGAPADATREDVLGTVAIFMGITLLGAAIGGYQGNRYHDRPLTGAAIGATVGAIPAWFVGRLFLQRRLEARA
ncbi:MAG: hypothetical protein JSV86_10340 [Gemmatimonadota bacterium]|nr:MAG: hypothetical protein JSV86_10340 [Gemmatimonadota bacterium]